MAIERMKQQSKILFANYRLSKFLPEAIAGLDAGRFGWSTLPLWPWPVGFGLSLTGSAMMTRSMAVNPFFEKTVRIQSGRGHRVIDTALTPMFAIPAMSDSSAGSSPPLSFSDPGGRRFRRASRSPWSLPGQCWRIGLCAKSFQATTTMRGRCAFAWSAISGNRIGSDRASERAGCRRYDPIAGAPVPPIAAARAPLSSMRRSAAQNSRVCWTCASGRS